MRDGDLLDRGVRDAVPWLRVTGEGMGMAAELNHYPGPKHVLELADSLGITAGQRGEVERIRVAMLARAVELGGEIVALERELDGLYAARQATDDRMRRNGSACSRAGSARRTSRRMCGRARLGAAQVRAYDRLRGHAPEISDPPPAAGNGGGTRGNAPAP